MFNSVLLDTIIGLSFIYLIYSFLCLVITETITRMMNNRHKLLQNALHKLFDGIKEGNLLPQLDENLSSIIGGLSEKKFYKRVSKITPEQLSEAVTMTLKKGTRNSLKAPSNPSEMLSYASRLSKMVGDMNLIDPDKKPPKKDDKTALIDQMEKKLNERAGAILDTVAAIYTRYAQKVALFVALFVVVINNADTINYTKKIYGDSATRNMLVASAVEITKQTDVNSAEFSNKLQTLIDKNNELLLGVESWRDEPIFDGSNKKADSWWWLQKIAGLLLTTALVSLGAPFWLDAIKKLVGLKKKDGEQNSAQTQAGTTSTAK